MNFTHKHLLYAVGGMSAVAVALATYTQAARPTGSSEASLCPKLSQASLDLDTPGCQTAVSKLAAEAQTSWKIEKSAVTTSPLEDPSGDPILYNVKVTEGPTKNVLVATGQLIVTNSGEQTPVLSSVVVNLQTKSGGEQFATIASAVAAKDAACRDGQGIEGGLTCFGTYQNASDATLKLTDMDGNDVTAYLSNVPIPPSTDCSGAVTLNFTATFNLDDVGLTTGDHARIELLSTFAGAGARGNSPETTSCTADVNCSGAIDGDDLTSCKINESETNNIRTVAQRASFLVPEIMPVCASVHKTDAGASSLNSSCATATSNSLDTIITKQGAGTMDTEEVSGTAKCGNSACSTDIVNTANLFCNDGRNEMIEGSPASAAIEVICREQGGEISVGDFCSATQGCWGQPGPGGFCASTRDTKYAMLVASFGSAFGIGSPAGIMIGDLLGPLGTIDGYRALWTSGAAVEGYLPNGTPAGTLTLDLLNPADTSSGVLDAQLLATTLNIVRDEAGLFTKASAEKLANLKLQACEEFAIAPALQGLTVKQLVCVADKATSGSAGCSGASIPSCTIAVNAPDCSLTAPVSATLSELVEALDSVNNNFDNCTTNLGCLRLP